MPESGPKMPVTVYAGEFEKEYCIPALCKTIRPHLPPTLPSFATHLLSLHTLCSAPTSFLCVVLYLHRRIGRGNRPKRIHGPFSYNSYSNTIQCEVRFQLKCLDLSLVQMLRIEMQIWQIFEYYCVEPLDGAPEIEVVPTRGNKLLTIGPNETARPLGNDHGQRPHCHIQQEPRAENLYGNEDEHAERSTVAAEEILNCVMELTNEVVIVEDDEKCDKKGSILQWVAITPNWTLGSIKGISVHPSGIGRGDTRDRKKEGQIGKGTRTPHLGRPP
ncbi:hypothetical protein JHK85_043368 [Glycine max]|nr:hypothetical protein JHK85_043368 [Glycine max]